MFRQGDQFLRVEHDDEGAPYLHPLTPDLFRYELIRAAAFYRPVNEADESPKKKISGPPTLLIKDMMATPEAPLPVIARITQVPTYDKTGCLQAEPGYSPTSRTYYEPAQGLVIPPVPERPTPAELKKAIDLITDELLGDFKFVGPADKAHAVAGLLLPFARELIDGPTPFHLIGAPSPGSGKGLLASVILVPSAGEHVGTMSEAESDAEWRKRITALLSEGHSTIFIDNIDRELTSPALSMALTSNLWIDRALSTNACPAPS
jgi:hypothetical protein